MISIKNGNVLTSKAPVIVHQVNCMSVMGRGLAKQIRDMYPKVYTDFLDKCNEFSKNRKALMGDVLYTEIESGKYVASVFGQYDYGLYSQRTDLNALKMGLTNVRFFAEKHNNFVALPYGLGCERGGADWDTVSKMINDVLRKQYVEIWE